MTVELKYLALVATFTALMWIPYILNEIKVRGVSGAVGYPANPQPLDPWAARMKASHYNAIENLAVFATLVLIAHLVGVRNETTALAAVVYFWARVVHFTAYTFRIPWVRTLGFVVGAVCQLVVAWQLLAR